MDQFMLNLRYAMIAAGASLAVNAFGKYGLDSATATSLVTPFVEGTIGVGVAVGSALWGNFTRWRTKSVPVQTVMGRQIPVVSQVTGKVVAAPPRTI